MSEQHVDPDLIFNLSHEKLNHTSKLNINATRTEK
jgi:hypothetical protein